MAAAAFQVTHFLQAPDTVAQGRRSLQAVAVARRSKTLAVILAFGGAPTLPPGRGQEPSVPHNLRSCPASLCIVEGAWTWGACPAHTGHGGPGGLAETQFTTDRSVWDLRSRSTKASRDCQAGTERQSLRASGQSVRPMGWGPQLGSETGGVSK